MTKPNPNFTYNELRTVLDVLNVYNPSDIEDVYPGMGEKDFLKDVNSAFKKVLNCVNHYKSSGD